MSDVITIEKLQLTEKHNTFHVDVITGRTGDYAINAVTGQVQKTLPATIRDIDWSPVGKFADGVTFTKSSDFAIDASNTQWIYVGASPFPVVVPAGTVPSAPDYQVVHVGTLQSLGGLTEPSDLSVVAISNISNITNEGMNQKVYPDNYSVAGVGSAIPSGTTHIRLDLGDGEKVYEMYPIQSGTIELIDAAFNEIKFVGNNDRTGLRAYGWEARYRIENRRLMGEYARKLRMHQNLNIVWYGDSNSEAFSNGVQAGFRGVLNNVYGTSSTTTSKAVSGRTAEWTYKLEQTYVDSDLSIIALGTNDGIYNRFLNGLDEIATYEFWMRKLIEREINWGNPVALVMPIPMRFDKEYESYTTPAPTDPSGSDARPDISTLGGVVRRLGEEYGCNVFDSVEWASRYNDDMFNNQTQSIGGPQVPFGDSIHLKSEYISAWGQNIAYSLTSDNAIKPHVVSAGDTLQVRKGTDPFVYSGGVGVFPYSWSGSDTIRFASGDTLLNERVVQIPAGKTATLTFYASQPMIAYPVLFSSGGTTIVAHNNYAPLSQRSVDTTKDRLTKSSFNGSSSVTVGASELVTNKTNAKPCNIYHRGWHSIQFAPQSGSTAWFSGIVFEGFDTTLTTETASKVDSYLNVATLSGTDNMNNLKSTGNYFAGDNVLNRFWPSGNTCLVEVIFNEWGTAGIQRATQINGSQYVRSFSGGAWGSVKTFAAT